MRRVVAVLLVFALVMAACSSGDDDESSSTADDPSGQTPDGDTDDGDEEEEMPEPTESPMVDDEPDETTDDDGDATSVSGFDEIPDVCLDVMEQFLLDIEPIVSPIDWDNATLADFEAIAPEFDVIADEFDAATEAAGQCEDIELDDDEGFALIVEFAGQVAPGTVGFMSFIADFAVGAGEGFAGDDGDGDLGGGDAAFEDCEGAVSWLMGLMAEYDSVADVPVAEVLEIGGLGSVATTCTPEQLEYLQSPEVQGFLSAA